MPDLLTCVTIGARLLVLGYAIALTMTVIGRIVTNEHIPRLLMFKHGFTVSTFVGLMGWLS